MPSQPVAISAVVCTRNRGASVVATIETILANVHPSFEIILVDQSSDECTADAIKPFLGDSRLRYIKSATQGVSRARNIGLRAARGEFVAFTDDDCTVPPNWLEETARAFAVDPRISIVFFNVEAAAHDRSAGFIPAYERKDSKLVRSFWDKCHAQGIGAGMAVRRATILAIDGFDEQIGPGAAFPACEEGDLAVRALIRRQWVYETNRVAVVHYGYRSWEQGKELTRRDWVGIGAAYAKTVKCGHPGVLLIILYEGFHKALLQPLSQLLRLRKPQGLRRGYFLAQGFLCGLRTPVDYRRMLYLTVDDSRQPSV